MNADTTIRDLLQIIRGAPRRILEVRVSSIVHTAAALRHAALVVAVVLGYAALLVALVTLFHLPAYFYAFGLVVIPVRYLNEWWEDRKREKRAGGTGAH